MNILVHPPAATHTTSVVTRLASLWQSFWAIATSKAGILTIIRNIPRSFNSWQWR